MTLKEIKEAHISLMQDGQIALTVERKNGKTQILRVISMEEVTNMTVVLFSLFKKSNPDKKMMMVPVGGDKVFAMTMIDQGVSAKESSAVETAGNQEK